MRKIKSLAKPLIITLAITGVFLSLAVGSAAIRNANEERKWQRICDGIEITDTCSDEDGNRYSRYVFHAAEPEVSKDVYHPKVPAVTRIQHHDAVYGTRQVAVCIKTTIGYKNGTCALSRCMDGEYSGSTGRGTCSYHGGVWYGGGPWYEYINEQYLITPAWDETIVVEPEKEAWTEHVVITPAKEAWMEKELAK